uniref:Uncharacterized protein n=1 Tax=Arundo donax TaxID=35708 RepID=A0A0A8YAY5_ARUDO
MKVEVLLVSISFSYYIHLNKRFR